MSESRSSLATSDLEAPGIRRVRCGRGFRYIGPDGSPLHDDAARERIRALVIPPAWADVWICPDPAGHIQATGTDAAGRRQYLYHAEWRVQRDRQKHNRVLKFGARLPEIRAIVDRDLRARGLLRTRVAAAAVRLIDLGFFRPGGTEYAEENGSYGLTTIRREHVRCRGGQLYFDYPGKSGKQQEGAIADAEVVAVIRALRRRRSADKTLFAYREGTAWHDLTAADINDYLREVAGEDFTAKDFRTWHATVLAAVALAVSEHAGATPTGRKRAIARSVKEVADYLGNTPAVARASYIDPRVIERYEHGATISRILADLGRDAEFGDLSTRGSAETALLKLLTSS
ncbi:MAG TPA: DNA topoisomerase IB [Streptosporangiaceae bacterium]|nr:DNA topoisomerase IB [Streptosporangiaceae bacterium]